MGVREQMKKILLATISVDYQPHVPYAVGCLISHCLKDDIIKANYEFLEPEYRYRCLDNPAFIEQLKVTDILGLTCYVWNQPINDRISQRYKKLNPNGIIIYGGPNVPEDKSVATQYANDRPFVDLFFVGPGEINFANFLKGYLDTGSINGHEGSFNHNENNVNLTRESYKIDYIPTPYTDGLFDNILSREKSVVIPIETNRGCPYRCTFCDWGGLTQSKITLFDMEAVKRNIDKTMPYDSVQRYNIIDANFGMFARDVELIDYIAEQKEKFNKTVEVASLGIAKNGSEHVKQIYSKMHKFHVDQHVPDAKNVKVSFQTFSPEALKATQRSNMTEKTLFNIIDKTLYNSASSELILGLPGETPDSWLDTLAKHNELKICYLRVYHLVVLPNTPMAKPEYIAEHKLKFTQLYLPTDLTNRSTSEIYKKYKEFKEIKNVKTKYKFPEDKLYYETYGIMSSSYSYTNAELKLMYLYYFWFNTFWNTNILTDQIKAHELSIQEQIKLFFRFIEEGKTPFLKSLVDEYKTLLDAAFSEDEIKVVDNLYHASFFKSHQGRGMELLDIVENLETFRDEIRLLYPSFTLDNIKEFNTAQEKALLLTPFVVLTKK
jgi:radical SAM superfamily enzyme YgiQ (UPF0313 family)